MTNNSKPIFNPSLVESSTNIINVAVAIIYHQDQYLLGYRNSEQHQGDKYEFIGGKIEANETATQAIIREVMEETGIDINHNLALKLGRLAHDYSDKQICLQVYQVELNAEQYQLHKQQGYGLEGQALAWVNKQALLDGHYPLPAANKTILAWLQLPKQIAITYPLAHFEQQHSLSSSTYDHVERAWLDFHQQQLPNSGWSYLRLKLAEVGNQASIVKEAKIAWQLMTARAAMVGTQTSSIIPYKLRNDIQALNNQLSINQSLNDQSLDNQLRPQQLLSFQKQQESKIVAYHLTQTELMAWLYDYQHQRNNSFDLLSADKDSTTALIVSCHDAQSIAAANQLAKLRLEQSLAPVLALFLSPVLATKTHADSKPLGWDNFSDLAQLADVPVIALGGLSPNMIFEASKQGATSVAGIRSFLKC